jgi:hypothetical protein
MAAKVAPMVAAVGEPMVGQTQAETEHLVLHYLQVLLRQPTVVEQVVVEAPKLWLRVEVEV